MIATALRTALCIAVLYVCASGTARSDILIGVPAPRIQDYWSGEAAREGILQAVADANASGELARLGLGKLRTIMADDQCDSRHGENAAQELVSAKVDVIIGHPCSAAAVAALPVYSAKKLLMISTFATNPLLTELPESQKLDQLPRLVIRMVGRDEQQAEIAAKLIKNDYRNKKIALIHDKTQYGKGLVDLVRENLRDTGNDIVIDEDIGEAARGHAANPVETVYEPLASRMIEKKVDLIYYGGYALPGAALRKSTTDQGVKAPMIGGDALLTEDFWGTAGKDGAENTYASSPPDTQHLPQAAEAVKALLANGSKVYPMTLHAYAAVQVWSEAVRTANSINAAAVTKVLHSKVFDTVIGKIRFNPDGDRADGELRFVWYKWLAGTYVPEDGGPWKQRAIVCRIQAALHGLNISPGPIDGLAGRKTYGALERFSARTGVQHSPPLNEADLGKIEEHLDKAAEWGTAAPLQERAGWAYRGRVCRAQAGLRALGHSIVGNLDGVYGDRTRDGLAEFLAPEGLEPPEKINENIVGKIEEKAW